MSQTKAISGIAALSAVQTALSGAALSGSALSAEKKAALSGAALSGSTALSAERGTALSGSALSAEKKAALSGPRASGAKRTTMNARKKNLDQKSAPACPVDISLLAAAGLLLVFGFIMVASASLDLSERTYGDPFYLLIRHGFYLVLALGAASLVLSLPIQIWQKFDIAFLGLALFLLCVVLVPGLGREVNGSTRWIPFGPFSLQGSEFVKLLVAVYISGYLVRRREEIETSLVGFIRPLLVLMLIVTLLLGQPDFGVAIVIVAAAMGVIFLAGVPWRFFLPLVAMTGIMVVLIATLQPYRLARLAAFADPWEHQFDSGYQLTQALIAFGRGEWLGLGLGNSIQKLSFLPEAHNDFIFSIIAEELGFVGAAIVILLFAWLVLRCLIIGLQAKQRECTSTPTLPGA